MLAAASDSDDGDTLGDGYRTSSSRSRGAMPSPRARRTMLERCGALSPPNLAPTVRLLRRHNLCYIMSSKRDITNRYLMIMRGPNLYSFLLR